MKNDLGSDRIWTPVCLVKVQTANHYTKGDIVLYTDFSLDLFYNQEIKKKSGPSREVRDQVLGWGIRVYLSF